MKVSPTEIPDVLVLEPTVFEDDRGFFFESFHQQRFNEVLKQEVLFVQDNHSYSVKNVLRGLHYQINPKAQGKLIRVTQGEVFDVVVDIRKDSPSFGQWISVILSGDNKKQLWVPAGFAHGYLTLSPTCEMIYKTTEYYAPTHDKCLLWNDEHLSINWPIKEPPVLSAKDNQGERWVDVIPQ
jgi:dTDP-4-dehydrorhamnose 3,5-epimerase